VEAILDWIIENLTYEPDAGASQGAYLTYFTKRGDCSDYSTLFVTLCRIQGIPARKIVGLVVFDNDKPVLKMNPGYKISYSYGTEGGSIPGHAWAEYYVPGYGFVSMDPTWAQADKKTYMNYMDYIHIANSVGENYQGGIDPFLPASILEFGLTPIIQTASPTSLHWEMTMDIEILEAEYKNPQIPFHTGVLLLVGACTIAILGIGLKNKIKCDEF
jgi:hypothetical protein